jgi:hypothetical protein
MFFVVVVGKFLKVRGRLPLLILGSYTSHVDRTPATRVPVAMPRMLASLRHCDCFLGQLGWQPKQYERQ